MRPDPSRNSQQAWGADPKTTTRFEEHGPVAVCLIAAKRGTW